MIHFLAPNPELAGFNPFPFLGNAHVQTFLGNLLGGPAFTYPSVRRRIALEDGDLLVVHESTPPSWQRGDRIAVLLHGLGGNHLSGTVQRMALLLWARGCRIVRVDLRGVGAGFPFARRPYHGGCSEDVRAVLREVHGRVPNSPLFVVGFSLGGNIALKLAGEAADDPVPGLERVAAIAPPIDFLRSVEMLERPRNRLYELYYVNRLVTHVRRRQRLFPDGPRVNFPSPLTMRLFDELYTAPMHGFRDALDYYQRASSFPFLPKIKVKTLVLTAGDDPFVAVETFREAKWSGNVDLHITERGGHLGFLGRDGRGGIRWAERMVARWILAQ